MYFGVAYYPEHWPEERWAVDAGLMQEAGVNGVRMGEFAWSAIEPVEGEYDFGWLDRAIQTLADHGIKTMMCTCSRTPPPWVFTQYPEIRNVPADRLRSNYGHRYTVCHNNPVFQELSQRIDRAVVEHYADNDHVAAWHIDNEVGAGNTCYCDVCHREFHAHLRQKYVTVGNLNERWGAHFWSFAFSDFDEIPLPVGVNLPSPSLALEYARFVSKCNVDFARRRYELMKQTCPSKWVTTNFQTERAEHTDIFDLGEATDVYGTNLYPPMGREFALDYCRGARGELIVLEQRSGQPHWSETTRPGWMRLWAWRSVAHGACGINFFRWRPCRWGQEEYWHAVLPHSGRPGRRYEELKRMGRELKQVGAALNAARPPSRAALVMGYDSRWALKAVLTEPRMDVLSEARRYHEALMSLNICADAMDPREDLSPYALVIAPRLYCVDEPTADNLRRFVEGGGTLCLTARSGAVDACNTIFEAPSPGPLRDIAGLEIDDYGALDRPVRLHDEAGEFAGNLKQAEAWADEIVLTTARSAAAYAEHWLRGMPAITVNEFGTGKVVYVGTVLTEETLRALIAWLCRLASVEPVLETPGGVRALERRGDEARFLFLLNFTETPQAVTLDGKWRDAFTDEPAGAVDIPPIDVRLLTRDI
jgi:beta-galactosidase